MVWRRVPPHFLEGHASDVDPGYRDNRDHAVRRRDQTVASELARRTEAPAPRAREPPMFPALVFYMEDDSAPAVAGLAKLLRCARLGEGKGRLNLSLDLAARVEIGNCLEVRR